MISPLLSLTGGNEFSTGLNIAALLNLPSLNLVNYLLLTAFFFFFVAVNTRRVLLNILLTISFVFITIIVFPRNISVFALLGLLSIFSCFLIFYRDVSRVTDISDADSRRLFRVYTFYIVVSAIFHFYLLTTPNYYANDRMMGIFKNPNQMGFFLVAYYLFYNLKIRKEDHWTEHFITISILLLVVLTGSRSALMALISAHLIYSIVLRKWKYLALLFIGAVVLLIVLVNYSSSEIVELLSRRPAAAVAEVGNMRFEIFKEIYQEGTPFDVILGKDVSIGTNGMIYSQKRSGEPIIWLDNLVNVVFYNWGAIGLLFFLILVLLDVLRHFPYMGRSVVVTIFFLVASLFFVLSDFFPLPFLIVYLRNDFRKWS